MSTDVSRLDGVIEKTLRSMEQCKHQIFEIAEQSRQEMQALLCEIETIKRDVLQVIETNDRLEKKLRIARLRLSEVSKNFSIYSEDDIRKAYENASNIQSERTILQEKEKRLREKRDELQFRLRNVQDTIERAEAILTQITVMMNYFSSDIKQMAGLLKDAHQHQLMGLQIIQAQEEERKRLSREIHDGPAQSMAHLVLRMDLVERVLQQEGIEQAIVELKKLKESTRESLADVRRIIFDLRPMALDDLGLIPTMKKYVERLMQSHSVHIEFKTFGREYRPSSAMEVAIFRLIQESLNNVIKHAQTDIAYVKIEYQAERIYVIVKDNGVGFDPEVKMQSGFGLMGMQERVKLLEGHMVIQSSPGKGTKVLMVLPIRKDLVEGEVNHESNERSEYSTH